MEDQLGNFVSGFEPVISPELVKIALQEFRLGVYSIHGPCHWARVYENGMRLVYRTGARPDVVALFALFHDVCRTNENTDHLHGSESARWIQNLRGKFFSLDDEGMELLVRAIRYHSDGLIHEDVTVQTCWDADRLDLARVFVFPNPERLCTAAARDTDILTWAIERAYRRLPAYDTLKQWGIPFETCRIEE
jgi:uncharacterized protein